MRVTDRMNFDQVTRNLQKNRTELADLQNQAATQKKITKPSDDPIASARILAMRTEDRSYQQFVKNIHHARSMLEATDTSLGELSEMFMRLKELAVQQANDAGGSAETRRVVAEEVAQTFHQAIQIGNRKLGDRFIFGGYRTLESPFDTKGNYKGDDGDLKVQVHKDSFLAANLPGDKVFLGRGVGQDGIIRPQAETPSDSGSLKGHIVQENNRIEQNTKQEGNPSQIQLRGPASQNQPVPMGEQNVSPSSGGGSSNQGVNVLKVIEDLEIGLRVNDKSQIQLSLDQLDLALNQVIGARAQVGARIQTLNLNFDSLQKSIVDNKAVSSQLEDVDLFQVMSDMSKNETTLKATLETSGRLVQPSLLDFLK